MANSIKEYDTTPVTETEYTTPDYLEGRESDIRVYLDDQETTNFTLNGTALRLIPAPSLGQRLRIERVTDTSSRLVDYTDGSLLTAETLDKDADHIFYVAQEAYDQSRVTNTASGKFYYSQIEAPTNPEAGTLWYNKSLTPNVLQIWNGTEWHSAAPVKDTYVYDTNHIDYNTETGTNDSFTVLMAKFNSSTNIFLNGVRLRQSSDLDNLGVDGDYFLQAVTAEALKIWFKDLASDDVVTIETFSGGYANTIDEAIQQFNADNVIITGKIDTVEPKLDEVIAYDIPQAVIDVNSDKLSASNFALEAQLFAENPHNNAFSVGGTSEDRFSAKHYSVEAADSAEQAARTAAGVNDPIEGWADVDNETITTVSSNDPIIYSNGTLTLKADDRVIIEGDLTLPSNVTIGSGTTYPIAKGFIDSTAETWSGSSGVTLTKQDVPYKWKIEHNDMVGTDFVASVTVNNTGSTSAIPIAKVEKHSGYLEIEVYKINNGGTQNSVIDADVFVEIYKFD